MTVVVKNGRIEGYLSVEEASEKYNIKPSAIRQMIHRGQIDTLQIGTGNGCMHFISEDTPIPKRPMGRPRKEIRHE